MNSFLKKLKGLFKRRPSLEKADSPIALDTDFWAAGVIFTDKRIMLAGYQSHGEASCISGIGGKRQGNENFSQTAIREMLEELFQAQCSLELIERIEAYVIPESIIRNDNYIILVYSFKSLNDIMKLLISLDAKSPIYRTFPKNLNELIFNRVPLNNSEISCLCLIPVVHHPKTYQFIDDNLLDDMRLLI